MPRSLPLYLQDLLDASNSILTFTQGMDRQSYEENELVQAAVERKFSIIGEAIAQMRDHHTEFMRKIEDGGKIIGFRNVLVHQYSAVDPEDVWSAVTSKVPGFRDQVIELIRSSDGTIDPNQAPVS